MSAVVAPAAGEAKPAHPTRRRVLTAALFIVWLAGAVIYSGTTMVTHLVTLPQPQVDDARLLQSLVTMREDDERGRWMAVHLFYAECRCSRRILDHIVETERRPDFVEKIVLVGDMPEIVAKARARGIAVEVIDAKTLERRFHVDAVPLMAVVTPDDRIAYLGGYTERKQGPDIQDLAIMDRLVAGAAAPGALPLFGCVTSQELREILDPFSLL